MSYEVCYTSSACNQTPTSAHWGNNKLICFASCNSIRIYDPLWGSGGKIVKTLCGHTKRVNSVRWISNCEFEEELVSGSTDGTAIVWSYRDGDYVPFLLKGHESIVNIVDGLYKEKEKRGAVVVTASMDSCLKIWSRKLVDDDFIQIQSINFGYGISTSLRLAFMPNTTSLILATGMDDSKILLYIEDIPNNESSDRQFMLSTELKGHENWVRGLDFIIDDKGDLLLASASQDAEIRLWRISLSINGPSDKIDMYELILKKDRIKLGDKEYILSLESILAGHEAWVYSVHWNSQDFTLLSASLDKSMILWNYDVESGLWVEKVRLGEVGGNTLGFYGGMFGPNNKFILAHGYHGAFHIWKQSEKTDIWKPMITVSGHFNEVVDLAWEPRSGYLITVSSDQTTRIHAPWTANNKHTTWHEIARPQVHGYDLSCIAMLSRYRFASGAEEKIVRTFTAPQNFIDNFKRICKIKETTSLEIAPKGASVPSLGLSNKAVYENDNIEQTLSADSKQPYPEESHFTAVELLEPPTEETLLQNTLWPEVQKLYGHGYELYSMAANTDGTILASACKATTPEHAAIILWDTSSWKQIQKLVSHTLTVVQIAFSPNSNYLLSVSRDRRWSLFCRNPETNLYELTATTDKKTGIHTRIIWCCAWTHDSDYFATGSREGKVVIWNKDTHTMVGKFLELKGESVTALAFAPVMGEGFYVLAVGLESGIIHIYKWNCQECNLFLTLNQSEAHHLTVKRLAFRPILEELGCKDDRNTLQLASCGLDHSVRIYNIHYNVVH